MIVHQIGNSIGTHIFNAYWYRDREWQPHFHKSFEFVYVKSGALKATISGTDYFLSAGDCLFLFPYQSHSFEPSGAIYFVALFSDTWVPDFRALTEGNEPVSPCFQLPPEVLRFLSKSLMPYKAFDGRFRKVEEGSRLGTKAALYGICDAFLRQAQMLKRRKNTELVLKILNYMETHYSENLTLSSVSAALGYDYHYISRVFNENLNLNFKTLLNQYRYEAAYLRLTETTDSLTDIAADVGFQSIRNFNEVVKNIAKKTPSAIRRERTEHEENTVL